MRLELGIHACGTVAVLYLLPSLFGGKCLRELLALIRKGLRALAAGVRHVATNCASDYIGQLG
eukprot:654377-Amphidinium_carterae.1